MLIDVLDYLMDNCNEEFSLTVSSKQFFSYLISLLKLKDSADIQVKILGMIEKWGQKFGSNNNSSNFVEVYNSLKKSGVTFPINFK